MSVVGGTHALPLVLALLTSLVPLASAQTTIHVPADQPTIQAGINAAQNGDTVLVAPGTYNELIDFKGKAITVTSGATSFAQASSTIINGGSADGPVASFQTGETPAAILNGFTLQNGMSTIAPRVPGGGVYIASSSPTISNNIIQNNLGCGILITNGGNPLIQRNLITGNTGSDVNNPPQCGSLAGGGFPGTGIAIWLGGNVKLIGNTISNNVAQNSGGSYIFAYGVYIHGGQSVTLQNNLLEDTNGIGPGSIGGNLVDSGSDDPPDTLLVIQNIEVNGDEATWGTDSQIWGTIGVAPPTLISINNTHYNSPAGVEFVYTASEVANNIFFNPNEDPDGKFMGSSTFSCEYDPPIPENIDVHADLIFNLGTIWGTNCTLGPGMVYADPQLVDPTNGDYRLQPTSPAINAGDINAPYLPATDFAGKNRTVCGTVDLGAYNHHPAPPIALAVGQGTISGGSTATFSVQLTGNCNTPTGPITFLDGGVAIGTATLSPSASATFSTSSLTVGTHTITATYPGDFNFDPSTSNPVTQVVTGYPTATTLTASPNPATALEPITLVTIVASPFGTPNGTVSFYAGTTLLTTATLDPTGRASVTITTLGAGSYSLTAVYSATTQFAASTSPIVTESVIGAPTATTLTATPNPSTYGQPVAFTAVAVATQSTTPPTGTITFRDSSTTLGSGPVSATGSATLTTATLAVGTHTLTAAYSGSANDNPSTSPVLTQIVAAAPVTLTLTASPNPANQGQSIAITTTATAGTLPPPGTTVTLTDLFNNQSTTLAITPLTNGQATVSTTTLAIGTHLLTATIPASGNYAAATSATLPIIVQQHDFAIALSPATITLAAGKQGNVTIDLTALGSYSGTLALTATSLPTYATATFTGSPATLTAGSAASAILTLKTAQFPPQLGQTHPSPLGKSTRTLPIAVALFLPLIAITRRRKLRFLPLLALAAIALLPTGCTTISYPLLTVAPGTYTLPITATDTATSIAHTATLTLTITPSP